MKIEKVEPIVIRVPLGDMELYWGEGFTGEKPRGKTGTQIVNPAWIDDLTIWRQRAVYSKYIETTLVRITTETGLVGYGECHAPVAPRVTSVIISDLLAPILVGEDALAVDRLWEKMYASMRMRGHNTGFMLEAIAGIDTALWDVAGKAAGVPICALLGGPYHRRVRVYQSELPVMQTAEMVDLARHYVDQGYTALKIAGGAGPEIDIKNVEQIRAAVGDRIELMLDAAATYDFHSALRVGRALDRLGVLWFEDPLPPEHHDAYVELCRALDVCIAVGESESNRYQFSERLARRELDIVNPDVARSGGISETRKIAMLADVHGVRLCAHTSICSIVAMAASVQLCAGIPNYLFCEFFAGNPFLYLAKDPMLPKAGYIDIPDKPGLGIEIDEQKLNSVAVSD